MNKKIITNIAVSIVVLLLVFLTIYKFFGPKNTGKNIKPSFSSEQTKEISLDSEGFTKDISWLATLGKDFYCELDFTDEAEFESSGKLYFTSDPKRMRSTFKNVYADDDVEYTEILMDGDHSYIWYSTSSQGLKAIVEDGESASTTFSEEDISSVLQGDASYDYRCKIWAIDEEIFITPSEIEFLDYMEVMTLMDEALTAQGSEGCSICNKIPAGDIRQVCLEELQCE